jgi:hypothetical protein
MNALESDVAKVPFQVQLHEVGTRFDIFRNAQSASEASRLAADLAEFDGLVLVAQRAGRDWLT